MDGTKGENQEQTLVRNLRCRLEGVKVWVWSRKYSCFAPRDKRNRAKGISESPCPLHDIIIEMMEKEIREMRSRVASLTHPLIFHSALY